jgi:peptidase E
MAAMQSATYLVGGGRGTFSALRRYLLAALAEAGSDSPLVAYVGAASNDDAGFFSMMRAGLALPRGQLRRVELASPRALATEARALLEDADLVFFSGGDVELGMRVLDERDVAMTVRRLAREGKPMFGVSAGSIMLAREWVRFPEDDDEEKAELFPCLGVAPLHVDAHDEDDGWAELRALLRLVARRGDDEVVGYGLTRQGGLRVEAGRGGVRLTPLGTDTPRFVVRGGEVVEDPPLALRASP